MARDINDSCCCSSHENPSCRRSSAIHYEIIMLAIHIQCSIIVGVSLILLLHDISSVVAFVVQQQQPICAPRTTTSSSSILVVRPWIPRSIPRPSEFSNHIAVNVIQKTTSPTTRTVLNMEVPSIDTFAKFLLPYIPSAMLYAIWSKISSDWKKSNKELEKSPEPTVKVENDEPEEKLELKGKQPSRFKDAIERGNNGIEKSITDLKAEIKDMIKKGNHGLKSDMEKGNNATEKSITELKAEFKDSINGLKNEMIELRGYLFWGKKAMKQRKMKQRKIKSSGSLGK